MNTHLHVTSWVLALILFAVVLILHKQGKDRGAKIVQMVLRLVYLLILYSGGDLLANYFSGNMLLSAIIKSIAGIWIIAAMEMVVAKMKKNKPTTSSWIQLIIAFIITIGLGFGYLPGGFLP